MIITSVSDLHPIINNKQNTLLLLDVDDTIITTVKRFSHNLDKLKELRNNGFVRRDLCEDLISSWRLERKVVLTDKGWPEFFINTKKVYGLTKMDVGKFGLIESVEIWRYNELKSLGVNFTSCSPIDSLDHSEPLRLDIDDSTFFKGIFFTGNASKGSVVKKILNNGKYDSVVFVDDKPEQLHDVTTVCNEFDIEITPIQFKLQNEYATGPYTDLEKKILELISKHENN
jgi:hypothetical protein